jgi:hypothetical protein
MERPSQSGKTSFLYSYRPREGFGNQIYRNHDYHGLKKKQTLSIISRRAKTVPFFFTPFEIQEREETSRRGGLAQVCSQR